MHLDVAAWIERNLVGDDGDALRLSEFQRDMLDRIASGERVVLYNARNPFAAATIGLALLAGGAVIFEGDLPTGQAARGYWPTREAGK